MITVQELEEEVCSLLNTGKRYKYIVRELSKDYPKELVEDLVHEIMGMSPIKEDLDFSKRVMY